MLLKMFSLFKRKSKTPFYYSLTKKIEKDGFAIIGECKKASPSAGTIVENYDPEDIAKYYEELGIACVSVVTHKKDFDGSMWDIFRAKKQCNLPILRKDFLHYPHEIVSSKHWKADCVLLIMRNLTTADALELESWCRHMKLECIAEIHNEMDLEKALHLQTKMIGINNRNLATLQVDIGITEDLAPMIPDDRLIISESGINVDRDIDLLKTLGVRCALIGESLLGRYKESKG